MLQKVVDSLSVHRLSKLYAFVDNAREGNVDDINKIEMCKKIIDKINFCDEVITIYPEVNLGCGRRDRFMQLQQHLRMKQN